MSTVAHSDEVPIVLARVMFLLSHPEAMPAYDLLEANCECVAVWAKTGTWATLQIMSGLENFAREHQQALRDAAGQALRSSLSRTGLWGALPSSPSVDSTSEASSSLPGGRQHASFAGLSPKWLAAYGVLAVATPKLLLWHTRKQWQAVTEELNAAFWEDTVAGTDETVSDSEEEVCFVSDPIMYPSAAAAE